MQKVHRCLEGFFGLIPEENETHLETTKVFLNTMVNPPASTEQFLLGKKRFQREGGIKQMPLVWADL